ncbi:MAG: hypothetical protein JXB30_16780 [Anaerolineae bacterium]|nr:hypothetical protein [Anaerolineae bacterium]
MGKILIKRQWIAVSIPVIGLHLLALWFVFTYTTTYPLSIDEWLHYVPRSLAFKSHTLSLTQVLSMEPMWGDGPPGPTFYVWFLSLPNVILFNWNLRIDSFINYVLIVVNIYLALYLLASAKPHYLIYLVVPVTALMLALQQRWNLLVGAHSGIHLEVFFALLTFVLVSRRPRDSRNILLAAITAFMGTFSWLPGWLTWGIVFPALWLLGYRRKSVYFIWVIGAGLSAVLLINLPGFGTGWGHYAITTGSADGLPLPVTYVLFFITWIGAVFNAGPTSNVLISMLMGTLGLLAAISNVIILWRRREDRDYLAVCGMLGAFSMALGMLTTVGRSAQFGVRWGMAHYYISFSVLFWISLGALIILMVHRVGLQRYSLLAFLNMFLVLMGVIFYAHGAYSTIGVVEKHTVFVRQAEMCIERTATDPAENQDGCEIVGGVALTEWIVRLRDSGLTGFASEDDIKN